MRRLRLIAVVAAAILALAVESCWCTTDDKIDSDPVMSWGGGTIAFERSWEGQIYVYYGASRRLQGLGWSSTYPNSCPAISPDSHMVAWQRQYPVLSVCFKDLRTGRTTEVAKGPGEPFWSPDGQWIGYIRRGEMLATNIRTGSQKLLASKLPAWTGRGKLQWLSSGPAVSLEKKGWVAWYAIQTSGSLKRVTPFVKLPPKPSHKTVVYRDWALSRDGHMLLCVDLTGREDRTEPVECRVRRSTRLGVTTLAVLPERSFNPPGPQRISSLQSEVQSGVGVAISGSGRKFVLSVQGGIWKGDVATGRLTRVTGPAVSGG
jgi:hypothetical protein